MVTREQAFGAGQEIGDLVKLLVDETPNKEQLTAFVSEGFQAAQALGAVGIPPGDREKVATNIAEGILNKLNTTVFQLP